MLAGKIHHLRYLGFSDFMAEHTNNRQALFMHCQHNLKRLCMVEAEEAFKNMNHEFHWRKIVVEKQNLIKWRPRSFATRFGHRTSFAITGIILVGHTRGQCCLYFGQREFHCKPQANYIVAWNGVKRGGLAMRDPQRVKVTTIGLDADDTLWHNEQFFRITQERFATLLADFAEKDHLEERLLAAERRNLGHYGFGVKGFVLSMIETAIEVTQDRVPARIIRELIDAGQDILAHPINLLPHARETVTSLAADFKVLLITKGDLLDQERKLAQSGLGDLFDGVEIVSHKTPDTYSEIFARHGQGAENAMMVGNSLRSDVIPALTAGSWGIYIPHELTWALELAEAPEAHPRYRSFPHLGDLPHFCRNKTSCD